MAEAFDNMLLKAIIVKLSTVLPAVDIQSGLWMTEIP